MTDKEALWVKVVKAKYMCNNLAKMEISTNRNASLTWRSMCDMWGKFKQGVGKKIGNGRTTAFWFENWSNTHVSLIDLIPGREGWIDRNERVVDYVDDLGNWNIDKLLTWFPMVTVEQTACAHPPREERGDDQYFWKPSNDGYFNIKSAYNFLLAGNQQEADNIWKNLWRWRVPEKIKTFMWLFLHNRVHTAELRKRRGIADTAGCPFGCASEETGMHMIKDCVNASNKWQALVAPDLWPTFLSLQDKEWVRWNLKQEAGNTDSRKVPWAMLFGYVCWDIWTARCHKVFQSTPNTSPLKDKESFYRACWDKDLIDHCTFYSGCTTERSHTISLSGPHVRLETDGSVLDNGMSGCGGVLRSEEGA